MKLSPGWTLELTRVLCSVPLEFAYYSEGTVKKNKGGTQNILSGETTLIGSGMLKKVDQLKMYVDHYCLQLQHTHLAT